MLSFSAIYGLERPKKIIQRALIEQRIASTYLFYGMEGIGKEAVAIAFAKAMNCENPQVEDEICDSCGQCDSCRLFDSLSSPNLELLFSLPKKDSSANDEMSDEQISDVSSQIVKKAKNPYHKISIERANQIRISSVRKLKSKLSKSQARKGRRFVIVFDAEEMTPESANAFLKTLEEPNAGVTIILISSRPEIILPTILSRCQQLHFPPIDDKVIAEMLVQREGLEDGRAKLAAAFASGSITKAYDFLSKDVSDLREQVVYFLRAGMKKKNWRNEVIVQIDEFVKNKDKNKIILIINLLLIWLRDAELIKRQANQDNIINIDHLDIIKKFAKYFGIAEISGSIDKCEIAVSRVYRNVNPKLILAVLLLDLRQIFLVK